MSPTSPSSLFPAPIVLIWLKYCWKGCKITSHLCIYWTQDCQISRPAPSPIWKRLGLKYWRKIWYQQTGKILWPNSSFGLESQQTYQMLYLLIEKLIGVYYVSTKMVSDPIYNKSLHRKCIKLFMKNGYELLLKSCFLIMKSWSGNIWGLRDQLIFVLKLELFSFVTFYTEEKKKACSMRNTHFSHFIFWYF